MSGKRLSQMAGLALATWLLGAAGMAYGQGTTWPGAGLAEMVEGARWKFGALRVNAAFTLANAGYDSDIYYGFLGGNSVPDYTFSATVPVQALIPLSKKVVLELSDSPQYVFYYATERERAWNNTFEGRLHFALDKLYIQAGGGMANVRRRFSPELDINIREKRDSLNGLVLWQTSRATSLALLYERSKYNYGGAVYQGTSIAERLDRNEDYLDMIVYVEPSSSTRFSLDGQYGIYTFTGGTSSSRGAKSFGVFGGIEFIPRVGELAFTRHIRGGLRVGYIRLDLADPGLTDGSGFAGEADVSADLTNKTSVHILFSRGFQFSISAGAAYYLSTIYGGGLSQRLSRRTSLTYDATFGRTAYPEEGGGLNLQERYVTHTLSLNLTLARHLEVTLLGTLGRRVRGASGLPLDRGFFGLSLTYGFPPRGMTAQLIRTAR